MLDFIESNVNQPYDIYFMGNQGAEYYLLTGQKNPTAYDFHQFSLHGNGSDIITDLEQHQTTYIAISLNQQSTQDPILFGLQPKLLAYLNEHFTPLKKVSHYQVFVKKK